MNEFEEQMEGIEGFVRHREGLDGFSQLRPIELVLLWQDAL